MDGCVTIRPDATAPIDTEKSDVTTRYSPRVKSIRYPSAARLMRRSVNVATLLPCQGSGCRVQSPGSRVQGPGWVGFRIGVRG